MRRTAECCCGKSNIVVEGEPNFNAVCHCTNCKKRTGSAFGVSVYFPEDKIVSVTDTTQIYQVDAETGRQQRHFCSSCGTSLYWYSGQFQNMVGIAGGCFIEQIPDPNISASNNSRWDWVQMPESCLLVET